jgi:hypothetical protein
LRDSWVVDSDGGYFVADAWSADNTPFSLYLTYWGARREQAVHANTGLASASVVRWTSSALRGRQPTSGLPAIAQIGFAVRLQSLVGATVDVSAARRALAALLSDGRYRASPAVEADWGSTGLAIETLKTIGEHPSPDTLRAYASALPGLPTEEPVDFQALIDEFVPLARGAVELRGELDGTKLAAIGRSFPVLARAVSTLPPSAGRVSATVDLLDVAEAMHLDRSLLNTDGLCRGLVGPSGVVNVEGLDAGDPQVGWDAWRLGCSGISWQPTSAPSRSGWPSAGAREQSLSSTVAGFELAEALGVASKYEAQLRTYAQSMVAPRSDPFRLAAFVRLRDDLRLPVTPPTRQLVARAANGAVLLAYANAAAAAKVPPASPIVKTLAARIRSVSAPGVLQAALLEQVSRLSHNRALHATALGELEKLSSGDGWTKLLPDATGPSLTAEAVKAWVDVSPIDGALLQRLGLCGERLCTESDVQDSSPTLAAQVNHLRCLDRGCGGRQPLIF